MRIELGDEGTTDDLRSLYKLLVSDDDFRGRAELADRPPGPGELGSGLEALIVAGSAGLGPVLVAWIRSRVGSVTVTVRGSSGRRIELSATHVAGLDAEAVDRLVTRLDELAAEDE